MCRIRDPEVKNTAFFANQTKEIFERLTRRMPILKNISLTPRIPNADLFLGKNKFGSWIHPRIPPPKILRRNFGRKNIHKIVIFMGTKKTLKIFKFILPITP